MRSRTHLAAAALLLAAASAARAQEDVYAPVNEPTGGYAGGSLIFARPQGEFGDFVQEGWGAGAHYLHRLRRDGLLAVRVDGSFLNYGHERFRVPLSPTIGGRVTVDVTTDNNIAFLGVGPQLGAPTGVVRPYVNGFVGVSYIFTSSAVEGSSSAEPFANTTNFDDASFSYGGGGGVYVPVRRGPSPISIDAGLTYRRSGRAEYLLEGGITDNPDGSVTLSPVRSETDLLVFYLGVSVGISR
ncbi:MAG TPA: hypothetical protein VEW03_12440 [Longimicrobiaceae bacterium]|nr:hypothetical protein [Longimicrobiaceae bacterium]